MNAISEKSKRRPRIEVMGAGLRAKPQREWNALGQKTQRGVERLSAKGKLHPDPEVRRVSIAWARDLLARKRRLLPKLVAIQLAASLVALGVVYLLIRLLDWDYNLFGLAVPLWVMSFMTLRIKLRTARRVSEIAAKGDG